MSGKKNPREWGSIRKQTTKSARYQASFIGPDLARHFAPVTFESKMMAERWLGRERDLIEKCAANDEPWQPPATRKLENKAQALSLATYGGQWIEQRKLKPRTRIEYERKFDLYIKPKLGKVAVRDLTPAAIRSWFSSLGTQHLTRNGHAYGLLHAICATAVHDGLSAGGDGAWRSVGGVRVVRRRHDADTVPPPGLVVFGGSSRRRPSGIPRLIGGRIEGRRGRRSIPVLSCRCRCSVTVRLRTSCRMVACGRGRSRMTGGVCAAGTMT